MRIKNWSLQPPTSIQELTINLPNNPRREELAIIISIIIIAVSIYLLCAWSGYEEQYINTTGLFAKRPVVQEVVNLRYGRDCKHSSAVFSHVALAYDIVPPN